MHRADDPFAEVFRTAANTDFADNPGSHLFSIDQQSTLLTGIVYEILIYANAHVEGDYALVASSTWYFAVVPDGYSILTSAGIGNAPAAVTPDPRGAAALHHRARRLWVSPAGAGSQAAPRAA